MIKTTILAAATLAVSMIAFQPAAQAGSLQIDVSIGGGYQNHGGHNGHGGGHWGHGPRKLSCTFGKRKLRWNGYRNINAYDCYGGRYGFRAVRGHRIFDVRMNAYTGNYNKRFVGFVR